MLIGIDGNEANLVLRVGVGQYAFNVLWNLHKQDKVNKYIIYLKAEPLGDMPPENERWIYRVFGPQKMWTKAALPLKLYLQKEKLDLFFSLSHYSPHFCPFPTVPTIHDLGYLNFRDKFTKKDLYQLINWTKRAIEKSVGIVAVSKFTKKTIIDTYGIDPQNIYIAYNGVDYPENIDDKTVSGVLAKFKIEKPYFIILGTLKPNKNIPMLIRAFSRYIKETGRDHELVIAGKKGWLFEDIFETVKQVGMEKKVIFTDYVNETEKWSLYKNTLATIIPSVYEGFGIPAIESMIMGAPVVVSNIPAFKEVVEDGGLYIDPKKEDDLLEMMKEVTKVEVRKRLIKKGREIALRYSWKNTGRQVLEAFAKISKGLKS